MDGRSKISVSKSNLRFLELMSLYFVVNCGGVGEWWTGVCGNTIVLGYCHRYHTVIELEFGYHTVIELEFGIGWWYIQLTSPSPTVPEMKSRSSRLLMKTNYYNLQNNMTYLWYWWRCQRHQFLSHLVFVEPPG